MVAALSSQFAQAVQFQAGSDGLHLHLPPVQVEWEDLWEQLQGLLVGHRWPYPASRTGIPVILHTGQRILELHHLQSLAALLQRHRLLLGRVWTANRTTAVAAAQLGYSVEQRSPLVPIKSGIPAPPLYIQNTLRSGVEIRHQGTVVILGDINPGAEVSATGDIVVLGRLRGLAHAGCPLHRQPQEQSNSSVQASDHQPDLQSDYGDPQAMILALTLQPSQLRIAQQVARLPDGSPTVPEVAYLRAGEICITPVGEYLSMTRPDRHDRNR